MAESKVNRENYIVVQGFMVKDLHLKGNELLVYAIVYGFSQAENQVFNGSLQYLADWTNSTKQSVIKCLKSLTEKGYLVKTDKIINGVKFCEYHATELNTVLNKVEYPDQQSLTGSGKQSLPNNITTDNKEDNKIDKKDISIEFEKLWNLYPRKIGKSKALTYYEAARNDGVTYEQVERGIKDYCKQIKAKKTEMQFIKHGSTWFYNKSWLDEYDFTQQDHNTGVETHGTDFSDLKIGEYF